MTNHQIDQDGIITKQVTIGMPTVYVRFKKLKEPQSVRVASEHNKRTRFFDHACLAYEQGHEGSPEGRILIARKNTKLHGPDTPEEVANLARSLMTKSGVKKLRKDAVRAIEVLLSLSPQHGIDDVAFFTGSMHWFAEYFGGFENLLAADIHRDEANDHVHFLFLPLLNGRMVGSQMIGGKGKLKGSKLSFDQEVCRQHSVKVLMAESLSSSERVYASQAVHEHLCTGRDPVTASAVWEAVRTSIDSRPEPYLQSLGIDVSMFRKQKKHKTMAEIFTSPGKGSVQRESLDEPVC